MPVARSLRRALGGLLLLVVGALAMLVLPATPVHASPGQDFAARINAERASRGISTLAVRADLTAAAQAQAERMADKSELFHNPNLGGSVGHWSMLAENVGYGPNTATIHAAFMASTAHRTNILNSRYTEVGVGVVVRDHVMWVAEVFRRPTGTSAGTGGGSGSHAGSSSSSGSASSHHTSTSSGRRTSSEARARPAATKTAHRASASRPSHEEAAVPTLRAVRVATAADGWLEGRPGTADAVRVTTGLVGSASTAEPSSGSADQAVPTTVFVGLGVLSLVLVAAAARVKLL